MEQQTTGEGGREMSVTSQVIHPQVMIEKWLLVVLIIGCTSLVFLICFPIDFFLYRRRKRLARKRKRDLFYNIPHNRAGIGHAYTTTDTFDSGTDTESDKKPGGFRATRGLTRFLSSIRKKRDETRAMNHIRLTESRSDNSSDFQITASLDTCQTGVTPDSKTFDENVQNKNTKEVNIACKSEENINSLNTKEDPSTLISSGRKLSNVSAAWSEYENVADSEIKRQNYDSLKTRSENDLTKESSNIKCLTIHVGSRDMVDIEGSYVGESSTEERDSEPNGKGIYKVKLNSSLSVFHEEYETNHKANVLENKRNSIVTLHPNREGFGDREIHRVAERRYKKKKLKHSRSDQCILYESFEQIYPTPKPGKKRNIVSPSSAPTLHSPEQCDSGVKPDNEVTIKQRSVSLSTHIEGDEELIPPKTRKKKRQSMPALK